MKLLDDYLALQEKIYEYFGYIEDWRVIPLDNATAFYWRLDGSGPGKVCYAETEAELNSKSGQYFENEIYTQRFLPKWVYRGPDFTMVCVDTHTDGNQFLQVFDNSKEHLCAPVPVTEVESGPPRRKKICGTIAKSKDKRIGGPRYVCTKTPGHVGECGDWKYMLQVEHAEAVRDGIEI